MASDSRFLRTEAPPSCSRPARSMGATEHERHSAAVHARGAATMHSSWGICSPFGALQLPRNLKPRHLAVTATWSEPEAFRRGPVRPLPSLQRERAQTETAQGASGSRAKRALPAPSIFIRIVAVVSLPGSKVPAYFRPAPRLQSTHTSPITPNRPSSPAFIRSSILTFRCQQNYRTSTSDQQRREEFRPELSPKNSVAYTRVLLRLRP